MADCIYKSSARSGSATVIVTDSRVIRFVSNIDEIKKILACVKHNELLKNHVVKTEILSDIDKTIVHSKIKHIIHSGEYTVSMAYDVTRLALDMASIAIREGIYSFDLLPHNFTLVDGEWILYDFGAFTTTAKQIKTQVRSTFKISFAAYELLRLIKRSRLKHYFLNRIKTQELLKMLPLLRWINWMLKMRKAQILYLLLHYKDSYDYLKKVQKSYEKLHTIKIAELSPKSENIECFKLINEFISKKSEDVFCIGNFGAEWALFSNIQISRNVYIDDYDYCDNIYNYIKAKKIFGISPAVLQPLIKDEEIPEMQKFRALYDEFTCERFLSDCVVLDFDEVYDEKYIKADRFTDLVSDYAKNNLIIKVNKQNENINTIKSVLSKEFKNIEIAETKEFLIISANVKLYGSKIHSSISYSNGNRIDEAELQSQKILALLCKFSN